MECPSCTADIPEGSRFCDQCGAPIRAGCPSCGVFNRPGAKFCSTCGSRLTTVAPAALSAPLTTSSQAPLSSSMASAERRQLTVMFCDLVGSTALSARMDPEDYRVVIGAYHRTIATTMERLGGF